MVPSERTVTVAVGHGKKAARAHRRLAAPQPVHRTGRAPAGRVWRPQHLVLRRRARHRRPALEAARRVSTFDEAMTGLDESNALFEARRCMSCGNCFGCDNCYGVCPDNAIVKLADGQYEIDYDYCKGCGLCAAECPCGAIQMQPEQA